jgi:hypothetical protein
MLPAFFAQFAAGCFLITALGAIQLSGWTYMRLMAAVCLGLSVLSAALLIREFGVPGDALHCAALAGQIWSVLVASFWLQINSIQRPRISALQALLPAMGGVGALLSSICLSLHQDALLGETIGHAMSSWKMATTTLLGAGVLGGVTCAMLLGHRYLTDTDMPIAPLRRMAKIYIFAVTLRIVWLAFAMVPLMGGHFQSRGPYMWFWLMISVRVGVGVMGVLLFAWMAWDCVKRRATQSATALFYLSMIFVFFGELAGQYLSRTEGLPL